MIRVHHSGGHNKVGMYSGVCLPLKQVFEEILLFQKKGAGGGGDDGWFTCVAVCRQLTEKVNCLLQGYK